MDKVEKNDEFIMKPKVDFCFKELMVDEDIRKGFISAVLGISKENIEETILLPTYLRKGYADDKLGILDVRVKINDGTQIDMEIQLAMFAAWAERSLFYLCKMYTEQIHEGDDYDVLKKCIHIGILDFILFEQSEEYASSFHIWEDERRQKYSDKLELHVLELPKLSKYEYPQTELLNWAKFINAEKKEEMEMLAKTDDSLEKAYEKLVNISADEIKRLEYEERQKALRDYNSQMKSNWEDGHKTGYAEVHMRGYTDGRNVGMIQGTVNTLKEFDMSKDAAVKIIVEKFSVSEEEARRLVEKYWNMN